MKRTKVLRRFVVSELSMSPALTPGDGLVAVRLRRPRRGRLVCVPHPERDNFWLVKRVIGLPGERIVIHDGTVEVDGRPLREGWTTEATEPDGSWLVPPGHVFVLSDARRRTMSDSRTFGPVAVAGSYRVLIRVPGRRP